MDAPKSALGPAAGVALLLLTAGAAWLWLRGDSGDSVEPVEPRAGAPAAAPSTGAPAGTQANAAAPTAANVAAGAPAAGPAPVTVAPPKPGKVTFPDGTLVDAINGVTQDVRMEWDNRPYSPIVSIVKDNSGLEWWLHQDGTYSTVQMNTVNGVRQPITMCAKAEEQPVPTVDEAIKRAREQQAQQPQQPGRGQ